MLLDSLLTEEGADRDWPAIFAAFDSTRRNDVEAIAQMALENYAEMRSAVLDARFVRLQAWGLQLERLYPQRFIPRYAMVMFHPEIPYSEALRRGAVQQQILAALDAERQGDADPSGELSAAQLTLAQELIAAQL